MTYKDANGVRPDDRGADTEEKDLMHPPHPDRMWTPRGSMCQTCGERAQGFGWYDPHKPRDDRTYVWFCSMACQSTFMEGGAP